MLAEVRPALSLRPYQIETVRSVVESPPDVWRNLVVAATGSGKTVMLSSIIDKMLRPGGHALVLAHREELLIQAKAEIQGLVPDLHVELEQAENRATREGNLFTDMSRHVVVGSVQTLRGKRLSSWAPDAFNLIIIDESHHATSSSYVTILEHFGCFDPERRTDLVGVTATPNRSDGVGLGSVFQRIAAVYGIRELVELGFLCGIRAINVRSNTDISGVKVTSGDFAANELEQAVDDDDRNALIVQAYKKWGTERPAIGFCAGVDHAHHLADWFRTSGIPSEPVWGAMGREERGAALARFKSGETQVLWNHSLLTEGFNEPKVSCIILARPTKSNLVVTQQVGRGTRLFPGKTDCLVIDVKDVTAGKSVVSVPSLAGLPNNIDTEGGDIFKAAKQYEKLDARLASRAQSITDVDEMLRKVASGMSVAEIDLMAVTAVDPWVQAHSKFLWTPRTDEHYTITPDKGETVFHIAADTLGVWHVSRDRKGFPREAISQADDLAQAFKLADHVIEKTTNTGLIDAKAGWRKTPPSDSQLALLARLNVSHPLDITKGQAAALISAALDKKPKR